jgi:hypothetical protein
MSLAKLSTHFGAPATFFCRARGLNAIEQITGLFDQFVIANG